MLIDVARVRVSNEIGGIIMFFIIGALIFTVVNGILGFIYKLFKSAPGSKVPKIISLVINLAILIWIVLEFLGYTTVIISVLNAIIY